MTRSFFVVEIADWTQNYPREGLLTIIDIDKFPQQFAQTRRFSLGIPRDFFISADGKRVLYIRSRSGTDASQVLWLYENQEERMLVEARTLGIQSEIGVASFAADAQGRTVAFTIDGVLWMVRTDGGTPLRITTDGPVVECRPSPDGSLIAYVTGGTLRLVRSTGTDDRPLAVPESEAVTYGLTDYTAAMSIGRRQGYWWSPNSDMLLVARVDAEKVQRWYVANPANPAERPRSVLCPTAGTANVQTTLLLVTIAGERRAVQLPSEREPSDILTDAWGPTFEYLVNAQWQDTAPVVSLQTRDQRTVYILRIQPDSGEVEKLAELNGEYWVD
jgi:dipeptidyl-peptidase 4